MSRTLDRSQGKFEAMPVSDDAPIVESGSNADGNGLGGQMELRLYLGHTLPLV